MIPIMIGLWVFAVGMGVAVNESKTPPPAVITTIHKNDNPVRKCTCFKDMDDEEIIYCIDHKGSVIEPDQINDKCEEME